MSCRPVGAGAGAAWRCSSSRQSLWAQLRPGMVRARAALPWRATVDLDASATPGRPRRRRRLGRVEPAGSGRPEPCAARWLLPPPPRTWLHRRCGRPPSTRRSRSVPRRRAAASGSGSSGRRWSPRPLPAAGTSSSATPIRPPREGACPSFRGLWPPPPAGPTPAKSAISASEMVRRRVVHSPPSGRSSKEIGSRSRASIAGIAGINLSSRGVTLWQVRTRGGFPCPI